MPVMDVAWKERKMSDVIYIGEVLVTYSVEDKNVDGVRVYDWCLSDGTRSDEWFDSAKEAIQDVERRFA